MEILFFLLFWAVILSIASGLAAHTPVSGCRIGQYILQVGSQGILSPGVSITAAAASPAVFTRDGSGSGQAIAVNPDGTICNAANPAARGSIIIVYFTGGGQTSPPGATGSIVGSTTLKRSSQTTQATIGDVPATVAFAGAAPGLLRGSESA